MNADLQAGIDEAIQDLQFWTAETVTLAGFDYPCTAADMLRGTLEFFQGGAADMLNISVCIRQSVLPVQPPINTLAVLRGINFRVKSVDDGQTLWQLSLVQEFA